MRNCSIEIDEECVEIFGDLTIEETMDFLMFFSSKGYEAVVLGAENSTLRMMKMDLKKRELDKQSEELTSRLNEYKEMLGKEIKSHQETKDRVQTIEAIMKTLASEKNEIYKEYREEIQKNIRAQQIIDLANNPVVKSIMKDMGHENG